MATRSGRYRPHQQAEHQSGGAADQEAEEQPAEAAALIRAAIARMLGIDNRPSRASASTGAPLTVEEMDEALHLGFG